MPHIVKNNATGSTYGAFPSLADAQAHQARLDKQWKRAKKTEPSPWVGTDGLTVPRGNSNSDPQRKFRDKQRLKQRRRRIQVNYAEGVQGLETR